MILLSPAVYDEWAAGRRSGDADAVRSARSLQEWADRLAAWPIEAVTDKRPLRYSPSPDLRSYQSIATYYWPNPDTADGLPFVERDGLVTPLLNQYDNPRWRRVADTIALLARAGIVLDRPDYSAGAAMRLRRWFIDPTSVMRPHLNNSQFAPGSNTGRAAGVIDFAILLPGLLDHALLLRSRGVPEWDGESYDRLRAWCEAFFQWLRTSPIAIGEDNASNNHGVYFDVLIAYVALFLGDVAYARSRVSAALDRRIQTQMRPDGSLPNELNRTLSLTYTILHLSGLCLLARIGQHVGVDLWSARAANGAGVSAGFAYLAEMLSRPRGWPHTQISPLAPGRLERLLVGAETGLGRDRVRQLFSAVMLGPSDRLDLLVDAAANPLIEIRRDVFETPTEPKVFHV